MATDLIVRTSDRNYFRGCRVKWDFSSKIRMNRRPVVNAVALEFGSAVHAHQQVWYDPDLWETDRTVVGNLAVQAFLDYWDNYVRRVKKHSQFSLSDDELENLDKHRDLGIHMCRYYQLWSRKRDENMRPVLVEVEFEVPIPGFEVAVYQGRVDLVMQDKTTGEYWIYDWKTAARFDELVHLDMDVQISSYIWALREMLGIPIVGFVYVELRKSKPEEPNVNKNGTLSKNKQQDTTYEMYLDALEKRGLSREGYEEYLEYLRTNPKQYVRRFQVHRSPASLRVIEQDLVKEATEMLDPEVPIYPNPTKFGCKYCAYRHPCQLRTDGSDYLYVLNDSGLFTNSESTEHDDRAADLQA
jgi:CRISPR/Cas system-associated exonuclease Cas4 (RecB family)